MNTLEKLARKHSKTDKFIDGGRYLEFYTEALRPYRRQAISLMEIGVRSGDSIRIWRDYFRKGRILGVDKKVRRGAKVKGARVVEWNAYNELFAKQLPKFDIIIDDGPGTLRSWRQAVSLYLPKVNQGGLFVIEDFWAEPGQVGLDEKDCEVIDLGSGSGRRDDRLLVVRP